MVKNLEVMTGDDFFPESNNSDAISNSFYGKMNLTQPWRHYRFPNPGKPPLLDYVLIYYLLKNVKGKKRKKEMKGEVQRVFNDYFDSLGRRSPIPKRALLLEESYNSVPEENEIENRDPKEVLNQRLYSNPGRQYPYLNGIIGNKKKSKDIKRELGNAAKYTLKEGWPIFGAGAGWISANNWYKKEIAKGLAGRVRGSLNRKVWEYIIPFSGQKKIATDAGKLLFREGLKNAWTLAKTPLLYAIGAYAVYKTLGYFLKRKKEKKLRQEEVESLERMRNDMVLQNRMALGDGLMAA